MKSADGKFVRIGILQCDNVRSVFREQGFDDYPKMFVDSFAKVASDFEFRVYRCVEGELPAEPGECDAYITTGSRFSVLDPDQWIRELELFVSRLVEVQIPFVGICFGHQLLAQAMGGKVAQAKAGWGVGVSENVIDKRHWWMADDERLDTNLIVSHQDQVVETPEVMVVLGGSEFCPIYFCGIGSHALSIQGHPEFSREYSRALMEYRRNIIPADVIEAGLASLANRVDDETVFSWIANFLRGPLN